ncbi:MAG: hypothetical protein AAGE52_19275 [Myxococcota bacterium]
MRFWIVILACAHSAGAFAQDDVQRARTLFQEAREDFEAGRYPSARSKLEESLRLAPRSSTAINLARVLQSQGELLEAERVLTALLENEYGPVPRERRDAATEIMAEISSELATVRITLAGRDQATLEVDGRPAGEIRDALERRLDPGRHRVTVVGADGARDSAEVTLSPGEAVDVPLRLPELAAEEGRRRGWIWALVGVAVAGAAAAVIATQVDRGGPKSDPVFPTARALHSW